MLRKILIGLGSLIGLLVVGVVGFTSYLSHAVSKTYDVPLPNIQRATSPEAIARGGMIFKSICAECHMPPGGTQAIGARITDLPPELGFIHSANITSDPEGGIGKLKDEEIARMIIYAINHNGKVRPMASFRSMADEDVAAVIGYLRSGAPEFEPYPKAAPLTELEMPGKFAQVMVFGINPAPREPVKAPPRAPTVEYGKYMAGVLDCVFCHTQGLRNNIEKEAGPDGYAGGFEVDLKLMGMEGFMYSPNITPAGIGSWTLDQFKLALREGVTADHYVLRKPMPRYRYVEDVELEALFAYLKTLPSRETPKPAHAAVPRPKADPAAAAKPEQLFATLGCSYCHGPKGQYRDRLKNALSKQPEDVAKWIRNPETFKPGTQMPTFASLIDEGQALQLAKWVQEKKGEP